MFFTEKFCHIRVSKACNLNAQTFDCPRFISHLHKLFLQTSDFSDYLKQIHFLLLLKKNRSRPIFLESTDL